MYLLSSKEGVAVTDLFRRPGNPQAMKQIIYDLENGIKINWRAYNFYTLANISKKFLLFINGGLLGPEAEEILINSLDSPDDQSRIEAMNNVIITRPKKVQRLMALYFGIWFRMIYHTEVNAMSVEAVAKSVAGSVFPSSCSSPERVEKASKVMEYLITGFASADLFGKELIEYFTHETKTSISRVEKFKYEFLFPMDVPREKSTRLFMRMLVAEAKKHGFDVIKNVVSKDVFEASNWNYAFSNEVDENNEHGYPTKTFYNHEEDEQNNEVRQGNDCKENVPPPPANNNRPRKPILLGHSPGETTTTTTRSQQHFHQEEITSPDSSFIQTTTTVMSATLTPKLSRHASFNKKSNASSSSITRELGRTGSSSHTHRRGTNHLSRNTSSSSRFEPVQQFCEKRTCVTASSDGKYDSDHSVHKLERSRTSGFANGNAILGGMKTSTSEHGCFNSVKERQMQRLQKRSDWFLSPPMGVRSQVLMQIDPTCNNNNNTAEPMVIDHHQTSSFSSSPNYPQNPDSQFMMNYDDDDVDDKGQAGNDDNEINDFSHHIIDNNDENNVVDHETTFYENNRHVEVRYFVVERYYGYHQDHTSSKQQQNWITPPNDENIHRHED